MSDDETTPAEDGPVEDGDRTITDADDDLDPEAPTDSTQVHPPRTDADRPVPEVDDAEDELQQENAATSLDQPSDQSS